MSKPDHDQSQPMQVIHPDAAGIDVAAEVLYVATNPERSDRPIRRFGAMTADIREVVAFLLSVGATTVALESTGPYWFVLYAELSRAGLSPILVDPRQAKQPSRRKTDVADAEWIRQLHAMGRFDGAFVITGEALKMRELGRRRCDRIAHQGQAVIVMQEQLSRMNIKLQHVICAVSKFWGVPVS
jgi:transposase